MTIITQHLTRADSQPAWIPSGGPETCSNATFCNPIQPNCTENTDPRFPLDFYFLPCRTQTKPDENVTCEWRPENTSNTGCKNRKQQTNSPWTFLDLARQQEGLWVHRPDWPEVKPTTNNPGPPPRPNMTKRRTTRLWNCGINMSSSANGEQRSVKHHRLLTAGSAGSHVIVMNVSSALMWSFKSTKQSKPCKMLFIAIFGHQLAPSGFISFTFWSVFDGGKWVICVITAQLGKNTLWGMSLTDVITHLWCKL